jgi:hypothetical protein
VTRWTNEAQSLAAQLQLQVAQKAKLEAELEEMKTQELAAGASPWYAKVANVATSILFPLRGMYRVYEESKDAKVKMIQAQGDVSFFSNVTMCSGMLKVCDMSRSC